MIIDNFKDTVEIYDSQHAMELFGKFFCFHAPAYTFQTEIDMVYSDGYSPLRQKSA